MRRYVIFALVLSAFVGVRASAQDKSSYVQVPNWGNTQWGVMTDVGINAKGNIYTFQREKPNSQIMVYDAQGKLLKTWAKDMFKGAHGLRVAPDGNIWVTDTEWQQAYKYDPDGKLLMTLGKKGVVGDNSSQDTFHGVSDVAVAANGDIFVADGENANTRIVKFSKDGKYLKTWGTKGAGDGQFNNPHCVAIDSKGRVWVCDRGNKRLQVFDQDGKFLKQFTQFGAPGALFIDKNDTLYVTGGNDNSEVVIGTEDGKILDRIGGFFHPHGIVVDSSGAIYVAEVDARQDVLKYVKK